MKLILRVFILSLVGMGFAGCASRTVLYEKEGHVKVYLYGEPEVHQYDYRIQFVFETPTDDPHLVQTLNIAGWKATEAFRTKFFVDETWIDTHWMRPHPQGLPQWDARRMVIRPGRVVDVDESLFGFSMLPGEWPDNFNERFRSGHNIQGRLDYDRMEHATIYHIQFANGLLTWSVEGTDIKYEWKAEKVVD